MNSNFSDLLRLLEEFEVRYLIVGGHAIMLYTEPRYTKDLDVWVEATAANAERVFQALAAFGAPLTGMSPADFAAEGYFYQLGRPPARIDILMSIEGVSFPEAWPNRRRALLGGAEANFIGRDDLLRNKTATGRLIDQHDANLLRKSKETR
ncbi:MAG: DUF6036 family nucleotidyltransferase [Bryobacteraceae bacterium]